MEISLTPSKNIDPELITQLQSDLELLIPLFTQLELGKRMGLHKTNFNKYIKGYIKITRIFLENFYSAWGEQIESIRTMQKMQKASMELAEAVQSYSRPGKHKEPSLSELREILLRIEKKIDRQIHTHNTKT